ncbi:MAG: nucleotide-binding universal stress UspA family protein [Yoonia sp.]|jgi:nucleotide-binding universal stress UspA family protein
MTFYAKMRITNPTPFYETPEHVLKDGKLSRDDKEKVLRSMVLDAEQMVEATAEGLIGGIPAYSTKDLQSALIQLELIKEPESLDGPSRPNTRFRRIMVVTTADQDLNSKIAEVAYDMAEGAGGKVYLLNVVSTELEGVGLAAASPFGTSVPLVAIDNTQIIEDRSQQLAELRVENGSGVETEIEVRGGQIEHVIGDYANDCNADVIVVGSPNRSWLEGLFDPSLFSRASRSAPCPVLVVPEAA